MTDSETGYTTREAITALVEELKYMKLTFITSDFEYTYDIEDGHRVSLLSEGVPDFPMIEGDVLSLTDFEWRVERIELVGDSIGDKSLYRTVFYLEDVI